jgi:hypothetical protein
MISELLDLMNSFTRNAYHRLGRANQWSLTPCLSFWKLEDELNKVRTTHYMFKKDKEDW